MITLDCMCGYETNRLKNNKKKKQENGVLLRERDYSTPAVEYGWTEIFYEVERILYLIMLLFLLLFAEVFY